jgi:membrane protease YdiL (CAAX protease family)
MPSAPTNRQQGFFFGGDGLRAGWSILLFLVLASITGAVAAPLVAHLLPHPPAAAHGGSLTLTPRIEIVSELLEFGIVLLPALLMSLIERRPFASYGLKRMRAFRDLLHGLFWGWISLSVLVGALWLTHGIAFDGIALRGPAAWGYAGLWAVGFLLVGLAEEFSFRGYLQFTATRGLTGLIRTVAPGSSHAYSIAFWMTASVLSAGLFMGAHLLNGGETPVGIAMVGLAGLVFAFALYRTGSLWWGIGMHSAWDWAQSFFYGTPDSAAMASPHLLATHPIGARMLSGGSDGPEGSVLGIPVLLLVALVIHLTLPRRADALAAMEADAAREPAGSAI